jgi:propanol-preferring alcohol dehydrogenase
MGQWLVIVGAAGGLGHLAIQYARLRGARVIAIDTDTEEEKKGEWLEGLGAEVYLDFRKVSVEEEVHRLTSSGGTHPISGAHAVIVTAASPAAFTSAGNFLRVGGVLSCVGIPPGKAFIELPVSSIVIKGLRIKGSLLGSLKDCMEAVELTRLGLVRPRVEVRDWRGLQGVYEELDGGKVVGRIVLKVANDS